MLRFLLLGPFEARRDDSLIPAVAWQTQNTTAVLKALVHARGSVVPAERLMEIAWPDVPPSRARDRLYAAIKTIRAVLEPEALARAPSAYIRTARGGYTLAVDAYESDVALFEAARSEAAAADRWGDLATSIERLRAAAGLYRGEYLADDPYADWAIAERERLAQLHLDVVERLVALLERGNEHEQAISWAERGLLADATREPLYRALMRCHTALGRRAHAIAVFERCRARLRSELDVEPDGATIALRDRLAGRAETSTTSSDVLPLLAVPFIGRDRELAALRRSTGTDPSALILVTGPAGIGKTRLVREFLAAEAPALRSISIAAHEAQMDLAYAPLVAFLRAWSEREASSGQMQRLGAHAAVLAPHVPRLRAAPNVDPVTAPDITTAQLFEAFTQGVVVALGSGRSVLWLDDLQWADPGTAAWLAYLVRRSPRGMTVVAGMRDGEPEGERVRMTLDELREEGRLIDLRLGPLDDASTHALVTRTLRQRGAELADRIVDLTRGHPLFLVETIRGLAIVGPGAGGDELQIAPTVQAAIRARFARLHREEREILIVASLFGAPFRAEVAALATEAALTSALDLLDRLLFRQWIRVTSDGRAYELGHPLFGRVISDDLAPGRRQLTHRGIADALAKLYEDDPGQAASERLRHLVAGNAPWRGVVSCAIAAGDHALARHANAEAARAFAAAREQLVARLPATTEELASVREREADALAGNAEWDTATALYEQLLVREGIDAVERSRLRRKLGAIFGDVPGRGGAAFEVLDRAADDLAGREDAAALAERVRVEVARGRAQFFYGDARRAIAHGARAVELAHGLSGIEDAVVEAWIVQADSNERLGDLVASETAMHEALTRARARGDRLAEADLITTVEANIHYRRGELRAALHAFERGRRLSQDLGVPRNDTYDLVTEGRYLMPLGELARSRAILEEAVARATAIDARYLLVASLAALGRTLQYMGDLTAARDTLERAIAVGERIGSRAKVSNALVFLAEVALLEDGATEARELLQRAIAHAEVSGDQMPISTGRSFLARALLRLGDLGGALAAAETAIRIGRERDFRWSIVGGTAALGEIRWALGERRAAAALFRDAVESYRRMEDRIHLVTTLYAQATTVLSGRPRERERALREALATARAIGMRLYAERCERELAATEAPVPA